MVHFAKSHDLLLAELKEKPSSMKSAIKSFDTWLDGCMTFGSCIEWGMPRGSGSYRILMKFLARYAGFKLWVYDPEEKRPYPTSFAAWGVNLQEIYFAGSACVVQDLKNLFQDDLCRFFVLDGVKLSTGDWAFLRGQARRYRQLIFVVRPYLLSRARGNPYAQRRFNCIASADGYRLYNLRGPITQSYYLGEAELWRSLELHC